MPKPPPPLPTTTGTLGLSDARTLFYVEYGKPDGTPVLFFHGFPASSREAAIWHDAAVRHSVRLISPDRPGIGLSSYQQGRRFLDWPADVAALAAHLGIDACHVLATAGGSPYALACLHQFGNDGDSSSGPSTVLPPPKVRGVAIVSGIYPLALGAEGIRLPTRITLWLVARLWFLLVPLLEFLMGRPARQDPELFASRLRREAAGRPLVDRNCLGDAAYGGRFIESARHAFAASARGPAYEAGMMGRAWGFELDGVGQGLSIWQGGFDNTCPAAMARKAHARMAGSRLRVLEYEGHLSLTYHRQDEILKDLLG